MSVDINLKFIYLEDKGRIPEKKFEILPLIAMFELWDQLQHLEESVVVTLIQVSVDKVDDCYPKSGREVVHPQFFLNRIFKNQGHQKEEWVSVQVGCLHERREETTCVSEESSGCLYNAVSFCSIAKKKAKNQLHRWRKSPTKTTNHPTFQQTLPKKVIIRVDQ